jgi:hypothetical protein
MWKFAFFIVFFQHVYAQTPAPTASPCFDDCNLNCALFNAGGCATNCNSKTIAFIDTMVCDTSLCSSPIRQRRHLLGTNDMISKAILPPNIWDHACLSGCDGKCENFWYEDCADTCPTIVFNQLDDGECYLDASRLLSGNTSQPTVTPRPTHMPTLAPTTLGFNFTWQDTCLVPQDYSCFADCFYSCDRFHSTTCADDCPIEIYNEIFYGACQYDPTSNPTTTFPTSLPTVTSYPTLVPSPLPTVSPSQKPTSLPTIMPSPVPTSIPTTAPTLIPTPLPTQVPSPAPTVTCMSGHIIIDNVCVACESGRYSNVSISPYPQSCYVCPLGKYQSSMGRAYCPTCGVGTV